ncbi:MAG: hypothetical protein EBZ36_12130, partial [Acidobacteria bacterium]|nr:hypothetical protein [Acidobacteriota bacterium]
MSILRSIVRNLRFILSRDLGGDLEALLNRLETRSDRYEQAIDERLELRLGAIEASLRAEMESAKALSTELIAALSERIREQQAAMLEQLEQVERRADDRLDSRLLEIQTAFDERATGYEQAVDRRIDERFNSIGTALDDRSAGYEQAVDRRIDERLNSIETAHDRRTADYEQAVDRRFDERLEALENTVSRRFIEYSRAADIRLDDRQAGLERRLDDFLRKLEERVDARHEAHELRIDQTLVSNRDDIIERTDLLLQVLDRRLDRLRTIPTTSSPRVDQSTEDSTPQAVPISREIYDWSENAASGMEIWSSDEQEVADYILSFIDNPAGREYVLQHMLRYLRTLHRIPPARRSGEQVLELGSLTPLAPAIRRYCGYQSICGSNYWPGEDKVAEKVFAQTGGGERLVIPLHNFNVETDRFPFPDGSFQVVLCGELLEH